jgi:hypothetical protein
MYVHFYQNIISIWCQKGNFAEKCDRTCKAPIPEHLILFAIAIAKGRKVKFKELVKALDFAFFYSKLLLQWRKGLPNFITWISGPDPDF